MLIVQVMAFAISISLSGHHPTQDVECWHHPPQALSRPFAVNPHLTHSKQPLTIFLPLDEFLLLLYVYINRVTQHVIFYAWLLSLSIMTYSSTFSQVPVVPSCHTEHRLFTHLPAEKHLSCHYFSFIKLFAVNM